MPGGLKKFRSFFGVSCGFARYRALPPAVCWPASMKLHMCAPLISEGQPKGNSSCILSPGATPSASLCWSAAVQLLTSLPSVAVDAPLAIKGYDPVAYLTEGKPTRGLPEFEYQWDEHRYQFASAQHRDMFKADPVHYAPQFGNFCAMALALNRRKHRQGESEPADSA